MSTVAEIKEAIAKLSPREYCELMAELMPRTDDDWDRQMQADAESGKFDSMNRSIDAAVSTGTTTPLEIGLEKKA